ncbi:hypothetical protein Tco_1202440 [Tanacetum coccineum]
MLVEATVGWLLSSQLPVRLLGQKFDDLETKFPVPRKHTLRLSHESGAVVACEKRNEVREYGGRGTWLVEGCMGNGAKNRSFRRCWRAILVSDSFVIGNGFGVLWCVIGSGGGRTFMKCGGFSMANSDCISGLRPEIKQFVKESCFVIFVWGRAEAEFNLSFKRVPCPEEKVARLNGWYTRWITGLFGWDEEEGEKGSFFGKFMVGVLLMSLVRLSDRVVMWVTKLAVVAVWESILVVKDLVASIKAVSWVVLRSAVVLVADMSCVKRSVSGGWLSSPVVSRRGGMAECEYVSSGSDCGRMFIWRKKDAKLVRLIEADKEEVNCIEAVGKTSVKYERIRQGQVILRAVV